MSLHLLPTGEQAEHQTTTDCPCHPEQGLVEHDGRLRPGIIHHRLDHHEPGRG